MSTMTSTADVVTVFHGARREYRVLSHDGATEWETYVIATSEEEAIREAEATVNGMGNP